MGITPPAPHIDDVTGRNVTSTTALTVIQQTIAPAPYPRSEIPNPANDSFPRQFQDRPQTRRAIADVDELELAKKRTENEAAAARDRRRAGMGEQPPRRRDSDYRQGQTEREPAGMVHADSAFVAQFIAQQIVPGSPGTGHGATGYEIAAYETTIDRIELFVDPFQAVSVRT